MIYDWIKTGHVIFVIFWMAGLFMLPRFFVYHQEADIASPEALRWVDREQRLIKIILNPAMLIVWALGLLLAFKGGWFASGWMAVKLVMVILLSVYHGWMIGYARRLAKGEAHLSGKQLRLINEVPSLAAAVIVTLVIIKPF